MTGFGRGTAEHAPRGTRVTVDIRAVNHRYLDLKLRGPLSPALEDSISSRVRSTVERGSVSVVVHVVGGAGGSTRFDTAAASAAHVALSELARNLGLAPPDLALVLAQPGVVVSVDEQPTDHDPAILEAVDAALAQLSGMRDGEGQALARELTLRVDELTTLRQTIEKLAAGVPERMKKRLHERLRRLLQDEAAERGAYPEGYKSTDAAGWLDPARLAQEVAVLADRSDVTEELVRLASHLEQARMLINGKAAAGRRLEFLVQEIGRELNTIGSKSSVTEISTAIVEAKAVLEKVREQVQNVE
jgi:uncharacterized protein YicC (UPF0701 family)